MCNSTNLYCLLKANTFLMLLVGFVFSQVSFASENVVFGYVIEKQAIEEFIGSQDQQIVQKILSNNNDGYPDIQARIDRWTSYHNYTDLKVEEVLQQLVQGKLNPANAVAYQFVAQAILGTLGEQLEDTSRAGVLSEYMDLWLDAPSTMMEQLGYTSLYKHWDVNRNPFRFPGEADWPTISFLNAADLATAIREAEKKPTSKINGLDRGLFEGRGDELSIKQLKRANTEVLKQLLAWVQQAHKRNLQDVNKEHYLVLVIDGDV